MRDLASALGVRASSLYNYVDSKEELLQQIVSSVGEEFLAAAAAASGERDAATRLRMLVRGHIRVMADRLRWSKVFVEEWKELSPPARERVLLLRRRYEQAWKQAIEDGIREGRFMLDPKLVSVTAKFLLGALNWMHQWYKPGGGMTVEAITEIYCGLALAAVGCRE